MNKNKKIESLRERNNDINYALNSYKKLLDDAYNRLKASKRVEEINKQALTSCENASHELHEKLKCYQIVLKDLSVG